MTQMTRRDTLALVPALALASPALALCGRAHAAADDPFDGKRLYGDLVTYAGMGDHNTASDVDHATVDWMAGLFNEAGLSVQRYDYTTRQFFPETAFVELYGYPFEGYPVWHPMPTGPAGVSGPFIEAGAADVTGAIVFEALTGFEEIRSIRRKVNALARAGAAGAIFITRTVSGTAYRTHAYGDMPIPALLIGSNSEETLRASAARGAEARLVITGEERTEALATNVIGTLGEGPRHIIVSTPLSGFSRAAGERGPGIALFIALVRWVGARRPNTRYTFVAPTGHEIIGPGIQDYVTGHAPAPGEVDLWLHLGAGIATYAMDETPEGWRLTDRQSDAPSLYTNAEEMVPPLQTAFADIPALPPTYDPRGVGTATYLMEQGYRVAGIGGGSAYHHLPDDLPFISGPEILEPVGRALAAFLETIEAL